MPNDKISVVGTNIAEKATVIWNVADILRGPFKPHEYGKWNSVYKKETKRIKTLLSLGGKTTKIHISSG